MSSSVAFIVIAGEASSMSASTTVEASRRPCSAIAPRTLAPPRLDHRQSLAGPDDDEIECRPVELLERRVHDELALELPDPHGADRAEERQRRHHQRSRRAVDAEHVVRSYEIGGERGADEVHLVAEALRPQGPDGTIDHSRSERGTLASASLPLEEAARDLPGGA